MSEHDHEAAEAAETDHETVEQKREKLFAERDAIRRTGVRAEVVGDRLFVGRAQVRLVQGAARSMARRKHRAKARDGRSGSAFAAFIAAANAITSPDERQKDHVRAVLAAREAAQPKAAR